MSRTSIIELLLLKYCFLAITLGLNKNVLEVNVMAKKHSEEYLLRPMTLGDIPQLIQIDAESFSENNAPPDFKRELLSNDLASYFVVVDEACNYNEWASKSDNPRIPTVTKPESSKKLSTVLWRLANKKKQTIVSNTEELIVGYIGLWSVVDQGHIVSIAVRESHRKQGVGELLIIGSIESNKLLDNVQLTLECRVSNQIAQKLYRKFGFKVVGRRKQYYSDNKEDAFIMTTDLINSLDYEEMFHELREKHSQKWGLRPRYLES